VSKYFSGAVFCGMKITVGVHIRIYIFAVVLFAGHSVSASRKECCGF